MRRSLVRPPPFTHLAYRQMLRCGIAGGYRFAGFAELAVLRRGEGRICLLRHDCDNDLVAAARLAEIEAEAGVRSTYFLMLRSAMYNLLAPTNAALVRRILDCGHWLGLHFDGLAAGDAAEARLAVLVDQECELLQQEFGRPVTAVSFHQPSRLVLDNRIRLDRINTYDRRDMEGVHYTSDSNLAFRGGDPVDLFAGGAHQLLQVLIHPEWWTGSEMSLADKWRQMLSDNLDLAQQSLRGREDTFAEKWRFVLRSEPKP